MTEEERIPDDPKYNAAAKAVTKEAGEEGEPLSWCIQQDGTLTVILPSGKKINRPTPALAGGARVPAPGDTTTPDDVRSESPRRRTDPKPAARRKPK
jgi:hypothetical protein